MKTGFGDDELLEEAEKRLRKHADDFVLFASYVAAGKGLDALDVLMDAARDAVTRLNERGLLDLDLPG